MILSDKALIKAFKKGIYFGYMSTKNTIASILENEPLYRKLEIDIKYWNPHFVTGISFQFYCQNESSVRTFKLALAPEKLIKSLSGSEYVESFKPFKSETEIEYVQYFVGHCQSCNAYTVYFLLHVFSEGEVQKSLVEPSLFFSKDLKNVTGKLMIRKVGQWPSFQIKPDSAIYSFLKKEDKEYYSKALICLSQNFGVAAFAYLRKIVESEIVNIVEELSKTNIADSEKIASLLDEYKKNKQTGRLVESIYSYLPNNLKVLGDNPFKLLYSYLSEGLHNHSDEECLSYALALDKLLVFTIKRVKEEQNELKEIRAILGGLRSKE